MNDDAESTNRDSVIRVAVLTTDTPHHRYYLRRLWNEAPQGVEFVLALFETRPYPWGRNAKRHLRQTMPNLWRGLALNPYFQPLSFARAQAEFENSHFFPDGDSSLPKSLPVRKVRSVNDDDAAVALAEAAPDLQLVYGTGVVKARTFDGPPLGTVNAHGGKLPAYRGLDTNLWAVLEGRPQDMTVTLHGIDAGIDTGPIYAAEPIGRIKGMNAVNLRCHTAILCTRMTIDLLARFAAGTARAEPQTGEGRYFGPMPWLLRQRAGRLLRAYAESP